jgi:hypothetical protein
MPPPPNPPPPTRLTSIGSMMTKADGELAEVMVAVGAASDDVLRHALEALESGATTDHVQLNRAQDLKRQVINIERGLNPSMSINAFVDTHGELISELEVDFTCCPTANLLMQQYIEIREEDRLTAAAAQAAARGDMARNMTAVGLAALFFLTCCCICLRRYMCIREDGDELKELASARTSGQPRRPRGRAKGTRVNGEDSDEEADDGILT